jgi:hypothetical protein
MIRLLAGLLVFGFATPFAVAGFSRTTSQHPPRGLTAAPQLARAYSAIFDARFNEMSAILAETCGPAPREACLVLDAVALWWQIQLDPLNTARDAEFLMRVERAIAATEAWTAREPQRAEAWFYLGGSYGVRVQWRSLRRQLLSAARDGKRIKDAMERALALDPALQDAYFGVGLYHYYADVAPATAKILRFLLLLPGGDRRQGLEEMLRARSGGQFAESEADYQLLFVYLWYEKQTDRALELLAALHGRHPRNPHFLQLDAEIRDVYLHDAKASLQSWQRLLDAARNGRVAEPAMAEATSRLGIALQLDRLSEHEAALPHLRAVIAAKAAAPYGAVSRAHLQLGDALQHLGRIPDATTAYRAAIASLPAGDPSRIRARAEAGLRALRDR